MKICGCLKKPTKIGKSWSNLESNLEGGPNVYELLP